MELGSEFKGTSLYKIGSIYDRIRKYDKAISCYNQALEWAIDKDMVYYLRGITYGMEEYNIGNSNFTEATKIKPEIATIYQERR